VPHAANTPSSGSTNPVVDQHEPGHSLLSQHAQRSTRPRGRQFFRHEQHLRKPQRNIPPPIPRGSRFATGQNCEIAEPPPVLPPGKREAPSLSPAPTGSATRCRSRTTPGAHPNGPEFPTRPNCCSDRSRPPQLRVFPVRAPQRRAGWLHRWRSSPARTTTRPHHRFGNPLSRSALHAAPGDPTDSQERKAGPRK
jgi:hypothetical protein